jgi:hypothetical protein
MSGDGKINRIKRENAVYMGILEETLGTGEALHRAAPNVAHEEAILPIQSEMMKVGTKLAQYTKAGGFDPSRKFQHVAHIPNHAVWEVVLKTFARYDAQGNLVDDGLLYKTDPRTGDLKLNRDFFYALLSGPLRRYDFRGKVKVD